MFTASPSTSADSNVNLDGGYDRLYQAVDVLWPSRPGRMVVEAAKRCKPGLALDAGCGDGKNTIYLSGLGWSVDAFDVSTKALRALRRRSPSVSAKAVWQEDCRNVALRPQVYDLIVAYGLYHCIDDVSLPAVHRRLASSLRAGGLFAFAAFNDELPIPHGHGTGELYLRPFDHIIELTREWMIETFQVGRISEDHLPIIGRHEHAVTWALFRKPTE